MNAEMIRYRIAEIKKHLEYLINAIPTSKARNMMTDTHIICLQAEEELSKLQK